TEIFSNSSKKPALQSRVPAASSKKHPHPRLRGSNSQQIASLEDFSFFPEFLKAKNIPRETLKLRTGTISIPRLRPGVWQPSPWGVMHVTQKETPTYQNYWYVGVLNLEGMTGIEPASSAWKAEVLATIRHSHSSSIDVR